VSRILKTIRCLREVGGQDGAYKPRTAQAFADAMLEALRQHHQGDC
jgi:hypothetical protein